MYQKIAYSWAAAAVKATPRRAAQEGSGWRGAAAGACPRRGWACLPPGGWGKECPTPSDHRTPWTCSPILPHTLPPRAFSYKRIAAALVTFGSSFPAISTSKQTAARRPFSKSPQSAENEVIFLPTSTAPWCCPDVSVVDRMELQTHRALNEVWVVSEDLLVGCCMLSNSVCEWLLGLSKTLLTLSAPGKEA